MLVIGLEQERIKCLVHGYYLQGALLRVLLKRADTVLTLCMVLSV